jgi:tetratricopeptide (TPR) repeat protein
MMMRVLPMVVVSLLALSALDEGVARPWKPNISPPAVEAVGRRRPDLDDKQMKLFTAAYQEGSRLLNQGHYHAALAALAKATRLNPDHVGARHQHARALVTLGYLTWNRALVKKAQTDVRHALQIQPEDQDLERLADLIDGLLQRMTPPQRKRTKR